VCEPDLLGNTLTERLDGKISFAIYEKASQSTRERNYGLGEKQPRLRTTCEAQTYGLRLLLPKNRVNEVRRFENRKRSFTGLCVMCIPCAPAIQRHVGLLLFETFSFKQRKSWIIPLWQKAAKASFW
jgi:hypothetical protein